VWPSQARVAAITGYKPRAVRAALAWLEVAPTPAAPIVEAVAYGKGGRGHTTVYRLHLDRAPVRNVASGATFTPETWQDMPPLAANVAPDAPKRGMKRPQTWHEMHVNVAPHARESVREPIRESVTEGGDARARGSPLFVENNQAEADLTAAFQDVADGDPIKPATAARTLAHQDATATPADVRGAWAVMMASESRPRWRTVETLLAGWQGYRDAARAAARKQQPAGRLHHGWPGLPEGDTPADRAARKAAFDAEIEATRRRIRAERDALNGHQPDGQDREAAADG